MPRISRDFHTPEGRARREAEARRHMESLTWFPAGERKPDAESGFVPVKLEDGSFSSAQWRHAPGDWLFGAHDRSGVVVAWSPPPPWHTCSQ